MFNYIKPIPRTSPFAILGNAIPLHIEAGGFLDTGGCLDTSGVAGCPVWIVILVMTSHLPFRTKYRRSLFLLLCTIHLLFLRG